MSEFDTKDAYQKCIAPFPKESISTDSSRGFNLTSVKAQYIIERLNEVFGVDGWQMRGKYDRQTEGVLFIGTLTIKSNTGRHDIPDVPGWGTPLKGRWGDAYKSARTDAIGKAASTIGIANEVFKGTVDPNNLKQEENEDAPVGTRKHKQNKDELSDEIIGHIAGKSISIPHIEDLKAEFKLTAKTIGGLKEELQSRKSDELTKILDWISVAINDLKGGNDV